MAVGILTPDMTHVNQEEIRHLADLARLELTEDEQTVIGHDLPKIVEFVDGLRQVSLTNESDAHRTVALENLRADESGSDGLTLDQLSSLAPRWEGNQLVVPPVFGEENNAA